MVLNTSFNENEPVVCRPEEALDYFLRTKMDVLVLGNHLVRRNCSFCSWGRHHCLAKQASTIKVD